MRHILALAFLVACSGRSGSSSSEPSTPRGCKADDGERAECLGRAGYQYVANPMANCGGGTPKDHLPEPSPSRPCECLNAEELAELDEQCKHMPASAEP